MILPHLHSFGAINKLLKLDDLLAILGKVYHQQALVVPVPSPTLASVSWCPLHLGTNNHNVSLVILVYPRWYHAEIFKDGIYASSAKCKLLLCTAWHAQTCGEHLVDKVRGEWFGKLFRG